MSQILPRHPRGGGRHHDFQPGNCFANDRLLQRVEQRTPLFAFPQLTEPKTQALKLIALYRTDPEITHLPFTSTPRPIRS